MSYDLCANRRTGRTTALLLKAIAAAIDCKETWIEFVDHHPHSQTLAKMWGRALLDIIERLELTEYFQVKVEGDRVFIRAST